MCSRRLSNILIRSALRLTATTVLLSGCAQDGSWFGGRLVRRFSKSQQQAQRPTAEPPTHTDAKPTPGTAPQDRQDDQEQVDQLRDRVTAMNKRFESFQQARQQTAPSRPDPAQPPERDSSSIANKVRDHSTAGTEHPTGHLGDDSHEPAPLPSTGITPATPTPTPEIRIRSIRSVTAPDSQDNTTHQPAALTTQPAPNSSAPINSAPPRHPANASARLHSSNTGAGTSDELANLIQQLEKKISDRPEDVAAQVKLRLLYAILGQWQQAHKTTTDTHSDSTAFADNLVKLIKIFDNSSLSSAQQAERALPLLEQLKAIVRKDADLKITALKLCRKVSSFDCYDVLESDYFTPNRPRDVVVYVEIDRFTSKHLPKTNKYQTLVALTIELIKPATDGRGTVLFRHHDERIEDLASKPRRDFYVARIITLPGMPEGKLILKATVEDLIGNKSTQAQIDLNVTGETKSD